MNIETRLRAARALIVKGWCQKFSAQDENGRQVPYGGPSACSWCMSGALMEVNCSDPDDVLTQRALRILREVIDFAIAPWNDQPKRTKEEVLAAYDRAIDLAAGIR